MSSVFEGIEAADPDPEVWASVTVVLKQRLDKTVENATVTHRGIWLIVTSGNTEYEYPADMVVSVRKLRAAS